MKHQIMRKQIKQFSSITFEFKYIPNLENKSISKTLYKPCKGFHF